MSWSWAAAAAADNVAAAAEHLLHIVRRSLALVCSVATSHHMLQLLLCQCYISSALLHSVGCPEQCCHSRLEVLEEVQEVQEM